MIEGDSLAQEGLGERIAAGCRAIHLVELTDSSSSQPWPRGSSRGRGLAYGCLLVAVSRVGAATGCDNVNSVTCVEENLKCGI